jgi:hypothetical protein
VSAELPTAATDAEIGRAMLAGADGARGVTGAESGAAQA